MKEKQGSFAIILIFIYVLFGVIIGIKDWQALVIYLTIFPFHIALLVLSLKQRKFVLSIVMCLLLVSQGLNSVLFFYNRENYGRIGYKAIGKFTFELGPFFQIYTYVLVFSILIFLIASLAPKKNNAVFEYVDNLVAKTTTFFKVNRVSNIIVVALCLFGMGLCFFMYNVGVGIIGLPQTALPFHLTGILYYFRMYVLNLLIIFFYLKCKNKSGALVFIALYTFVAGFASVSRSLIGIPLLFIVAESFLSKHYKRMICSFLWYAFLFAIVTKARNLVYFSPVELSFFELIAQGFEKFDLFEKNLIVYFIDEISTRLYGAQCTVLSYQYEKATFADLLNYYMGASITEIVPDMMWDMFGFRAPAGMAVGVSVGYIGQMMLLANHNYFYVCLQAIWVALVLMIMEKLLQKIVSKSRSNMIKIVAVGMICFSMVLLWFGLSVIYVYLVLLALFCLSNIRSTIVLK